MFEFIQKQRIRFDELVREVVNNTSVTLRRPHPPRDGVERLTSHLRSGVRKQKMASWLSEATIAAFLVDQLLPKVESSEGGRTFSSITDAYSPSATETWAAEIGTLLLSLPWKYEAWLELPLDVSEGDMAIDLGNGYATRPVTQTDRDNLQVPRPDPVSAEYYHRQYPDGFAINHLYFVASFDGYVRGNDSTPEMDEVVNAFKGLIGLLVAENTVVPEIVPSHNPTRAAPIVMYRLETSRETQELQWLSQEDSWLIRELRHVDVRRMSASDAIESVGGAFRDSKTLTAARWYLDSFARSNSLVQIVQATIALEILLGDRADAEAVGIATLLANRLAYLTGTTPSERNAIIREFKRLYDLRSQIVHAGKNRLESHERKALEALQRHCKYAIHEHVRGFRT